MSRPRRRLVLRKPRTVRLVGRRTVHERGCWRYGLSACGGSFHCRACGRLTGNCRGGSDDFPHDCDECWLTKTRARAPSERGTEVLNQVVRRRLMINFTDKRGRRQSW